MPTVRNLAVSVSARVSKFLRGMAKARQALRRFARRARGMALALGAVGIGVGLYLRRTLTALDATAKWSDRLGVASARLAGLEYAAGLSGIKVNQLRLGLQRMTRRVAEAAQGMGEAQGAIKELGLSAISLVNLTPDEQLLRIADAMQAVESQSDRVRLAFKLFDSEGVALINMLKGGAEWLRAMQEEAEGLGIAFSRDTLRRIEEANDAIHRLQTRVRAFGGLVAAELAPDIHKMAGGFNISSDAAKEFAEQIREVGAAASYLFEKFRDGLAVITWGLRGAKALFQITVGNFEEAEKTEKKLRETLRPLLERLDLGHLADRWGLPRETVKLGEGPRKGPRLIGGARPAFVEEIDKAGKAADDANRRARAFADATAQGLQRLTFAGREFRDVLEDIAYQFANMAAQHLIFDKIAKALFPAFGGKEKPVESLAEAE